MADHSQTYGLVAKNGSVLFLLRMPDAHRGDIGECERQFWLNPMVGIGLCLPHLRFEVAQNAGRARSHRRYGNHRRPRPNLLRQRVR